MKQLSRTKKTALAALCALSALLLTACEEGASATAPPSVSSVSSNDPAPTQKPSPSSSMAPSSTVPETPSARADIPVASSCGTVTAASGLTLQVIGNESSSVECTEAKRIISAFHQAITGRQSADSTEPASATVDGWLCVSGAPAAQGGTTCSKNNQMIFAAVMPVE